MISTSIKLTPGVAGFGVNSASLFRQVQMRKLGEFAIDTVVARAKKAIGSEDNAMPPLSGKTSPILHNGKFVRQRIGYAGWKAAHGLHPVRDLTGTGKEGGHMLDNLSVRLATENQVRIALTSRSARAKAIANERRTPWLSFSPRDEEKIVAYARQLFRAEVEKLRLLPAASQRAA